MLIMFAAEEAVLVEIHPSYRQDRHFRHASRLSGKAYMPLRSRTRETCVGSSDTVFADINELRIAMDGALRLARSFGGGLAECGLRCSGDLLALDRGMDPAYKNKIKTGDGIDLSFPC